MAKEFDYEAAREFQRAKQQRRQEKLDVMYDQAIKDHATICEMIIEKYQPEKIYQWGSLLNRRHFSEISDIDIAVEGVLGAETYFSMLKDAESLTKFPLDLVQIEHIHPLHRDSIIKHGKLIYVRKES